MLRSSIIVLRKRFPWLLRPVLQRKWKAKIECAINSGEFLPNPDRKVHFPDYERADLNHRIPLIFHQTWRTKSVPSFWRTNREVAIQLHPSPPWKHRLWTDEEISQFVQERFPQYWEPFNLLPKPIMRIDIFRYMVLWEFGGVYADLDFLLFKAIDDLIADCTLLIPAESDDVSSNSFCGQHFLASCSKHPFWEDCLKACLERPVDEILAYDDPLKATGPDFITNVWRSNSDKYRAKIPLRVYLAPPSGYWYGGVSIPPLCYGIHQCHGTWR